MKSKTVKAGFILFADYLYFLLFFPMHEGSISYPTWLYNIFSKAIAQFRFYPKY